MNESLYERASLRDHSFVLFYACSILDIRERPGTHKSGLDLVDDVNILPLGSSTEEDCRMLENLRGECERWASKHGPVFALK